MVAGTAVSDISLMVHLPDCANVKDRPEFYVDSYGVWSNPPCFLLRSVRELDEVRSYLNMNLNPLMHEMAKNPISIWPVVQSIGSTLYQSIIPSHVNSLLEEAASTAGQNQAPILRIHLPYRLDWIPWEIMYNDNIGFLGLHFQIARLPIMPRAPDMSDKTPHQVHCIYNLLGQHIEGGEFSFNVWQSTFADIITEQSQQSREYRYPVNQTISNWPTINEMADAAIADILHITCHGGLADTEGMYWTLDHKSGFRGRHDIRIDFIDNFQLRNAKPLVFGNACSLIGAGKNDQYKLPLGFGATFFKQGAVAFIGTNAPITKRVAVEFPRKFYEYLLKHEWPVGRALWATKRYFDEQKKYNPKWNDPSWLLYCLYGPPESRFQIPHS